MEALATCIFNMLRLDKKIKFLATRKLSIFAFSSTKQADKYCIDVAINEYPSSNLNLAALSAFEHYLLCFNYVKLTYPACLKGNSSVTMDDCVLAKS